MEQTAKTKATKLVCIVLAAVIASTALAAGLFVYFNSNTFRFRMSVFRGEYVSAYSLGSPDFISFDIKYEDKSFDSGYGGHYCVIEDGKAVIKKYVTNEAGKLEAIEDTSLDKNISELVKKYAYAFDEVCTVYNDKIVFGNICEMKITENKYYKFGKYDWQDSPERFISAIDANNNQFNFSFTTSFYDKKYKATILIKKGFQMVSNEIEVKTTDGETKRIKIKVKFYVDNRGETK